MDRFYAELMDEDFNIRAVTKGALTQARAKLDPLAFKRLNQVASDAFYQEADHYTWHGMRLLSCDGSRLMLPRHQTVEEAFGSYGFGPKADSKRSMAMCSLLYDTLNHITLDAQIDRYDSSERDLLLKHLDRVEKGDLLLLDRGYPCFWLLYLLEAKGIEYCVRLKDNWWVKVNEFVQSGQSQQIVEFTLPDKDQQKLKDYPGIIGKPLKCRLVRVELEDGQIEVLCTSLLNPKKYKTHEFAQLYHHRWNQEEAYKLLKSRCEMEKFSGKTAHAVQQDFHAKTFMMTMCAIHAHPIEEKVKKEYREASEDKPKHQQKINRTHALATFQDMLVPLFLKNQVKKAVNAFSKLVYATRELIRPNRSLPRNHKPKRQYHMNCKPL
jgi:hypothetical protein